MSLAAAVLLISQSASPTVATAPVARRGPVAVQARASVRVVRPARIDFREREVRSGSQPVAEIAIQRGRDEAGTVWIEFN